MSAAYVCSICLQHMSAAYVCSICLQYMSAIYVCSICVQHMSAAYVRSYYNASTRKIPIDGIKGSASKYTLREQ